MSPKLGAFAVAALIGLAGCRARQQEDPALAFDRIHAAFLHGQLDAARQAAAEEKMAMLTRDRAWSFRFCLLETEILQFQGRSPELVAALDAAGKGFTPTGDLAIKRDLLLTLADRRLGYAERSAAELREAIELSAATHSALQGEVLRAEGLLANRDGRKGKAEDFYRESLAVAREQKDAYLEASDLLNLGQISLEAERLDESLDRFNASSRLAETIHADVILQMDEGNAGWVYYALGDFERALDSFRGAREQARRLGATDSEILWLQSEGLSLAHRGDLKQAQERYEEALRAAVAVRNIGRQAEIDTSLGLLFLELEQTDAARAHANEALKAARQIGDRSGTLVDASLLDALIAARSSDRAGAEEKLLRVLQDAAKMPSIRWQAEDALAGLYGARGRAAQGEQWHRRAIRTFEEQRDSVSDEEQRLPFFANGDALYRHYAEFLIADHRIDAALRLLDSGRAEGLREGLGVRARGARVAGRVGDVTLFYSLGPRRSYLWAIERGGTRLFVLPAEGEIAGRVQSYQASILRSRDPLTERNQDAVWLYEQLIAPAKIRAGARVLVVPDASLNGFNFETLLVPERNGPHYWIEDVSVTTASSLEVAGSSAAGGVGLRLGSAGVREGGRVLVMGDALLGGVGFDRLSHAGEEVAGVERAFPGERHTAVTGGAAVPGAYGASHPEQYEYLHFVAHGMASSLRPLDSAIVLSPEAGNPDRYKLYAREIVRQPLHARLVTISSCYGSGVRSYAGEGLVGLSWAFLRAGAHQVIGALWEVNDSSTPELMDRLYRGLAKGEEPDEALRAAKLEMLHSRGVFRKPLYWGAFQLYSGS